MYEFSAALIKGRLLKRYKRFLADVRLENNNIITVHCPNTGAMTGCASEGAIVYLSVSDNPKRKYRHTWEYSSTDDGSLIGINTANANRVIKSALESRIISEFHQYSGVFPETVHGDSRIDFMLREKEQADCFIEVKSVTLTNGSVARFPDTVSKRGAKHCYELARIAQSGCKAYLLFCIQRHNIDGFEIAKDIDPDYYEAVNHARSNGLRYWLLTV